MGVHIMRRGDALQVDIPADADDGDWATLCAEVPAAAVGRATVTVDVSALALIPAEVVRLNRLISLLAAVDVATEVATSERSVHEELRLALPRHVPIVLPWSERAPQPPADAPVTADEISP